MFGMTPKVPDWLEMGMSQNVDPSMMQTGSVQPNKGGMFGGGLGSALGSIAGTMGDYFLQRSGMQPMYGPQMAQQRMLKMQEEQYQRHRQDSLSDYEAKQRIDQQYPTAPQPTEYERLLQSRGIQPGTDAFNQHLDAYLKVRENPTQYIPGVGLVQMGGVAPSGPPPQAIEHLKANPALKGAFDEKYGPGAADRILGAGGPSLGGSGSFPY